VRRLSLAVIPAALAEALHDPGHLGQQVGPACGEVAQLPHRGGVLVLGKLSPSGLALRRTVHLRDEDPVSLRAVIEHAFHFCAQSGLLARSA
jgi:hypothetical protein